MKTTEFLDYIIDIQAKGGKLPSLRKIAKEFKVSPAAIQKNVNQLVKRGYFEKFGYGKYKLCLNGTIYEGEVERRRMKYLEEFIDECQDDINRLENSNEELERSNIELRKSNDFLREQNRIMDSLIKGMKAELDKYRKRGFFKRLFNRGNK